MRAIAGCIVRRSGDFQQPGQHVAEARMRLQALANRRGAGIGTVHGREYAAATMAATPEGIPSEDAPGGPAIPPAGSPTAPVTGSHVWSLATGHAANLAWLKQITGETTPECAYAAAWRKWGIRFAEHVQGAFAIAIWSGGARHLTLVRDRLGVEPLYYAVTPELIAFGSSPLDCAAAGAISLAPQTSALAAFLQLGFEPPQAEWFAGVRAVLPGHVLEIEAEPGTVKPTRYWALDFPPEQPKRPRLRQHAGPLREALIQAVAAGGGDAIAISGGMASAGIAALRARHAEPAQLIVMRPAGHPGRGDRAALLGEMTLWPTHSAWPEPAPMRSLDRAAAWGASPAALPAALLMGQLAGQASAIKARRLATGLGAAELFALPVNGRRGLRALASRVPMALAELFGFAPYAVVRALAWREAVAPLLAPVFREMLRNHDVFAHITISREWTAGRHAADCQAIGAAAWLIPDAAAAWHAVACVSGLAVTHPYLEPGAVLAAARLPGAFRMGGSRWFGGLRRALRDDLPEGALADSPQGDWRGAVDLAGLIHAAQTRPELAREAIEAVGVFDALAVKRLQDALAHQPLPEGEAERRVIRDRLLALLGVQVFGPVPGLASGGTRATLGVT